MKPADLIVNAARGAIGCRTRAQGRNTGRGLDCVGLVAMALARAGFHVSIPSDYSLRADNRLRLAQGLYGAGLLKRDKAAAEAGDVLHVSVGPGQHHLAVSAAATVIHADFARGRIVEVSFPSEWRLIAAWHIPETV